MCIEFLVLFDFQNMDDRTMKSAIVDILCCVVEYNPSMVRDYLLKEANRQEEVKTLVFM